MPGTDDGPCTSDGIDWWHSEHAWASPPPRPRRERRRPARFIAALLARLRPPAGNHHALPAQPAPPPVSPPRPARDGGVPLAQITSMDIPPHPPRRYVTQQQGMQP